MVYIVFVPSSNYLQSFIPSCSCTPVSQAQGERRKGAPVTVAVGGETVDVVAVDAVGGVVAVDERSGRGHFRFFFGSKRVGLVLFG